MPTVTRCRWLVRLAICAGLLWAGGSRADELADRGREVFEKQRHGVVTVQIVVKRQYSSHQSYDYERKLETTGAVMNGEGLTVVCLSAIDPTAQNKMMWGEDDDFRMSSEATSVKILLEDGAELPARIILRDPDLDLAFVRPVTKPAQPLPYVNFTDAAEARVLDTVVVVNRLGEVARRAYSVSLDCIEAVVAKPRTFYVPSQGSGGNATVGCPAFALDGRIIGVAAMRTVKSEGLSMQAKRLAILVPAKDVLEGAAQAPPFDAPVEQPSAPAPAP